MIKLISVPGDENDQKLNYVYVSLLQRTSMFNNHS
jgi:hypothetical protein